MGTFAAWHSTTNPRSLAPTLLSIAPQLHLPQMATVAFSFGPFGDIIATIQLAYSILNTLRSSTDSTSDCVELAKELENLTQLLHAIHLEFEQNAFNDSVKIGLQYFILRCRDVLAEMHDKMETYSENPARTPVSRLRMAARGSWIRVKRAMRWAMADKEAMMKCKHKLLEQILYINTLLLISNRCVTISLNQFIA